MYFGFTRYGIRDPFSFDEGRTGVFRITNFCFFVLFFSVFPLDSAQDYLKFEWFLILAQTEWVERNRIRWRAGRRFACEHGTLMGGIACEHGTLTEDSK